jgi:N-acetylglutamate synthase-like GNAT family acetyltransferase
MNYKIIVGADKINIDEIMNLLKQTYWADKRSQEQVEKSIHNSQCYGVYLEDENILAGFARVITDFATTYYLCDVIIDPKYQNNGLGVNVNQNLGRLLVKN